MGWGGGGAAKQGALYLTCLENLCVASCNKSFGVNMKQGTTKLWTVGYTVSHKKLQWKKIKNKQWNTYQKENLSICNKTLQIVSFSFMDSFASKYKQETENSEVTGCSPFTAWTKNIFIDYSRQSYMILTLPINHPTQREMDLMGGTNIN